MKSLISLVKKSGKKLKTCNKSFFAKQKRFIAGFLIFLLISFNCVNAYSASLSATLALGDSLSIAAGGGVVGTILAPEVIIPMALVALGIAGIGYVAKSNVVEEIAEELKTNYSEWTVLEGGGGNNNKRPFLKGWFKAGKVFLSEVLLGIIAKIAIEKGLFNGTSSSLDLTMPNVNNYEVGHLYTFTAINCANLNDMFDYAIEREQYYKDRLINAKYFLSQKVDLNLYTGYVDRNLNHSSNGSSAQDVYVVPLNEINLQNVKVKSKTDTYVVFDYQIPMTRYYISDRGINENTGIRETTQELRIGYTGTWYYGIGARSNGYLTTGIPNSGNIPSVDDEDIRLPNWNNPSIEPDPEADPGEYALPVSLPDGYELPLIYPPEYPDELPDDLNLPNYEWPDNLPNNPNYPDPNAQDEAQKGLGVSTPIVNDPFTDIQKESFLLPDNIINKFPFCIPFDMVKCVRSLSVERSAPNYTWNYNIANMSGSVNLDLSIFNEAASVFRTCELAVFVIGLIVSTKRIIEV